MGIMPLDHDTRTWWSADPDHGIGMRLCAHLDDTVRVSSSRVLEADCDGVSQSRTSLEMERLGLCQAASLRFRAVRQAGPDVKHTLNCPYLATTPDLSTVI